ncbi:MAG: carboxypeptidase-like regulatory domain-containing protein [Gemmatimonadaceae bacterium]
MSERASGMAAKAAGRVAAGQCGAVAAAVAARVFRPCSGWRSGRPGSILTGTSPAGIRVMIASSWLRRAPVPQVMVFAAIVALPLPAMAQLAVLSGRILDSAGVPIESSRIRVPRLERFAVTDANGRYRLDSLPAGRVTIVAEAPGFHGSRVEVIFMSAGMVEQSFTLVPNSHVLAAVDVRARTKERLPYKLAEFQIRRQRGTGRFMGPADVAKFDGQPLTEALKTILTGARFVRSSGGELTLISSRTLNIPTSMRPSDNAKSCGIQIWQDGVLLSDPNASADLIMGSTPTSRRPITAHIGADKDFDISALLSNTYMAVEYYSDLSMTPPGFRTGTASCGVLVLWTREPLPDGQ